MKHMKIVHDGEGVPYSCLREIAILKAISHQHVERLFDVFCKPHSIILVSELWIEALTLWSYMKLFRTAQVQDRVRDSHALGPGLEPGQVQDLSQQLLSGLEHCHAHRIIHRALQPKNLYIDALHSPTLKIGGFKFARAFSLPVPQYTHEVVNLNYKAPEILLGSRLYGVPIDVWSVGCILGEMATGSPVIHGETQSEIAVIFSMFSKLGTPDETVWPGVSELPDFKPTFPKWKPQGWANIRNTLVKVGPAGIDLLEQLLCYDPRARISARRALAHPYFDSPHPTDQSDCAGPEAMRRPTVGDEVLVLATLNTQKHFPNGIGKTFIIRTDAKDKQPYQVTGHDVWLHALDVQQAASDASCLECKAESFNSTLEAQSARGQSRKQRRQQGRRAWKNKETLRLNRAFGHV